MHAATLPAEILLHILELVPSPEDLCRCARVCSRWYAVANDDALWVRWAERYAVPALFQETSAKELHWREREKDRYGVWLDDRTVRMDMATTSRRSGVAGSGGSSATASDDVDVAGGLQSASTLRSPRAAFEAWHGEFRGFRELFPRMYAVVVRLSRWLRRHSPATLLSLQAGKYATADGWTKDIMRDVLHTNILSQMNVGLPMTTDADGNGVLMSAHQLVAEPEHIPEGLKELLLFYYFYDGQRPKVPFTDLGLFGCFLCYDQYTSVFMFPASYLQVQSLCGLRVIIFAACPRNGKYLALVVGVDDPVDTERAALAFQVVELDENHGLYLAHGTFLSWFERYVEAMEHGLHDTFGPDKALCMFPNDGPYTSHSVARGIEIRASAIAALEMSSASGLWFYRIKLNYVGGTNAPASCQLTRRRWIIRYKSGHVSEVEGDGVVGEHPIMNAESQSFNYCSACNGREFAQPVFDDSDNTVLVYDPVESMEGAFEFLIRALGDGGTEERFCVPIAPFRMPQPRRLPGVEVDGDAMAM